jgi:hypothetical protein
MSHKLFAGPWDSKWMNLSDNVMFFFFEKSKGKGRLVGWSLMCLGFPWALLTMCLVGFPCMFIDMVSDIDREVRKKN